MREDLAPRRRVLRTRVRRLTGQQEEERAAEAVDVGAGIHQRAGVGLLGGEVVERADDLPAAGEVIAPVDGTPPDAASPRSRILTSPRRPSMRFDGFTSR